MVFVPLAALPCCAVADQLSGDGEQHILALSANGLHDRPGSGGADQGENPGFPPAHRPFGGVGPSSTDQGPGVILKAAWPPSKFHVSRRCEERRFVASLASFVAVPSGSAASNPMSKASSVLSAEYALLRRLEL